MQQKNLSKKIVLPGGAGLVGQNLVAHLKKRGYAQIVVLDKHRTNLSVLQQLHPDILTVGVDLAERGEWERHFEGADHVVMLQAQIGGIRYEEFARNNLSATQHILDAIKNYRVPHLIHISSSVVESRADDFYTNTKKAQEELVKESGLPCPILRPTLMFGWFDRKHLGWLAHFMKRTPCFPIPGRGRYLRQPLYVGDFCRIILSCLDNPERRGTYLIAGQEKIEYIEIIRAIRTILGLRTPLLPLPCSLFDALLWGWSLVNRNPPFTRQQRLALTAGDEFPVIDWPTLFGVPYTPFQKALEETLCDPLYSPIRLEF